MAEFVGGKEKTVGVDDFIIFENNTDSNFEVSTGIVFRKSGVYEVSIVGNRTIVSKVSERKTGKWILVRGSNGKDYHKCSECLHTQDITGVKNYCAVCGADMMGDSNGSDCKRIIKQLPSAEPEIIRCKDCKHRDPENKKCDCGHDILWQLPRDDDWFCADADMRGGKEDEVG